MSFASSNLEISETVSISEGSSLSNNDTPIFNIPQSENVNFDINEGKKHETRIYCKFTIQNTAPPGARRSIKECIKVEGLVGCFTGRLDDQLVLDGWLSTCGKHTLIKVKEVCKKIVCQKWVEGFELVELKEMKNEGPLYLPKCSISFENQNEWPANVSKSSHNDPDTMAKTKWWNNVTMLPEKVQNVTQQFDKLMPIKKSKKGSAHSCPSVFTVRAESDSDAKEDDKMDLTVIGTPLRSENKTSTGYIMHTPTFIMDPMIKIIQEMQKEKDKLKEEIQKEKDKWKEEIQKEKEEREKQAKWIEEYQKEKEEREKYIADLLRNVNITNKHQNM